MLYLEIDPGRTNLRQRNQAVAVDGARLKIDSGLSVYHRHAATAYIMQNNFDGGRSVPFWQWYNALDGNGPWRAGAVKLPSLYA